MYRRLKRGIRYVFESIYLELLFSNLLLFFSFIFIGFNSAFVSFITFFVFASIVLIRFFRRNLNKSLISYYFITEGRDNNVIILFGVLNFLVFFYLITSIFSYYGLVARFSSFELFIIAVLIRVFLMFEIEYTQNWVLLKMIEEVNYLGEYENIPSFATRGTRNALQSLDKIKQDVLGSLEEKVKSERMKTELITNISHDLKTPLTSIINYTDILSKKEVMDEEAQTYINILSRNSNRLKTLIIDLIDASKAGTGNVKVERGFIEFNELVSQIYGDFDEDFQKKSLEFVYGTDTETLLIYSDGYLLSRIIQNLLSNAFKYSLENTRVYSNTFSDEERVYFNIKNVSKKKLNMSADELIEQFIRGEKSRTTEGSGLGLHITRNLVEILGGEFRVVIDGDLFQAFVELPRGNEDDN